MEQSERNKKFVEKNLLAVCEGLSENETRSLIQTLKEDENNPYSDLNHILDSSLSLGEKKMFVIMQFTKDRYPVEYLAQILRQMSRTDVSAKLLEFNKTEQFMAYFYLATIYVKPTRVISTGQSQRHDMHANPRGVCLIIVNELAVLPEAEQQAHVFSRFYFRVRLMKNVRPKQIKVEFQKLCDEYELNPGYNALVTSVVGHGEDDKLYLGNESIKVNELLDVFIENSEKLQKFAKIHIFNMCRTIPDPIIGCIPRVKFVFKDKIRPEWVSKCNKSTVIYACSQRQYSNYSELNGFTKFGRAFNHVLAQFAHQDHLGDLFNKLNQRMENVPEEERPEKIDSKNPKNLFFNPGIFAGEGDNMIVDDDYEHAHPIEMVEN